MGRKYEPISKILSNPATAVDKLVTGSPILVSAVVAAFMDEGAV